MIVLLDMTRAVIKIYTEKGIRTLAFESSDLLKSIIGNNKVLYVTNGVPATADEILATVNAVKQQRSQELRREGEPLILRSTAPGVLNIPGMFNRLTKEKEDLVFKGPFDGKTIVELCQNYGKTIFQTNRSIAILMKSGKLQLLPESEFLDMQQRFENGDFTIEADAEHFRKKMKLLAPGVDPKDPINFDITRSVNSGSRATGRENNESVSLFGAGDIIL